MKKLLILSCLLGTLWGCSSAKPIEDEVVITSESNCYSSLIYVKRHKTDYNVDTLALAMQQALLSYGVMPDTEDDIKDTGKRMAMICWADRDLTFTQAAKQYTDQYPQ